MQARNTFWMIYVKEDSYGDGPYWWPEIFTTKKEATEYRKDATKEVTRYELLPPAKTYIQKVEINAVL